MFWAKDLKASKFYKQIAKKNSSKNTKATPFFLFHKKKSNEATFSQK